VKIEILILRLSLSVGGISLKTRRSVFSSWSGILRLELGDYGAAGVLYRDKIPSV
jgi:hypothetical protein